MGRNCSIFHKAQFGLWWYWWNGNICKSGWKFESNYLIWHVLEVLIIAFVSTIYWHWAQSCWFESNRKLLLLSSPSLRHCNWCLNLDKEDTLNSVNWWNGAFFPTFYFPQHTVDSSQHVPSFVWFDFGNCFCLFGPVWTGFSVNPGPTKLWYVDFEVLTLLVFGNSNNYHPTVHCFTI